MELDQLKDKLCGVLAFTPTLMHNDATLDLEGQRRHADFLADSGAAAIVVCGGVGEFYALSADEYIAVVRETVDAVSGRVPVLAGVGHSTAIAAGLGKAAAAAGADGLMVNPLYFVRPDVDGLVAHYREIGQASGLGMVVFSTEGAVYDERALERLAEVEATVAVKDEAGDLALFLRCVERLGDRYVWINGMAELRAVDYAAHGAVAMTSGLVNLDPSLALDVWAAAVAGDRDRHAALVRDRIQPVADLRAARPGYHITVIKEAMQLLGRGGATVRLPLVPMLSEERDLLAEALRRADYVPAGTAEPLAAAPR